MAREIQVILVDDIDGGDAQETVSFGLDGTNYEIDLNGNNAAKLRDALDPFVEAARRVPAKRTPRKTGGSRGQSDRERTQQIREWAKANGKSVNERGRIPAAIVAEYEAIHG